jgi:hypothetical protein
MRISLGVACATMAMVAAATGCGSYSSPNDSGDSPNSPSADSTGDTTSMPPPSPYLQR